MAPTRSLAVVYRTEGFAQAIASLQKMGKSFDEALASSQRAAREAAAATKRVAEGDIKAQEKAEADIAKAVRSANQAIQNSYRELRIKSTAEIEQKKAQAISAYTALKISGTASAKDIANAQVALRNRLAELDAQLDQTGRKANQLNENFTILKATIANLLSSAILNGIAGINNALQGLARNVISAGVTAEQQRIAIETLLGSAERAQRLLKEIFEFTATTQFQLPEVTDAAKQLLAANVEAKNLVSTIKMLGEIASGTGKPLENLLYVYAQLKVQNRAYTQDLMQLTNAGVPIYDELAKIFGVGANKVRKLVEEGKVGFKEVNQILVNMTSEGGKFYGLIDKLSSTAGTKLSNLADYIGNIYRAIYDGIEPALSASLDVILGMIKPLGDNKSLWGELKQESLEFQKYLKDNPEIAKVLAEQLEGGVKVALEGITKSAKKILEYLQQNPKAIANTVEHIGALLEGMAKFAELIGTAIEGWRKIGALVGEAATAIRGLGTGGRDVEATRDFVAQNLGKEGLAEFEKRYKEAQKPRLGGNWDFLIPGKKEQIAEQIAQDLIVERAERNRNAYGPPMPENWGEKKTEPKKAEPKKTETTTTSVSSESELTDKQKFALKTVQIAKELNLDPQALLTIMMFESGGTLSPTIQGPEVPGQGRGRGLIQFMPATARGLGTSDADLAKMSQLQQLDWVKKYFAQFKGRFGAGKLENLYAAVLAGDPMKVNASDGYVTAREGANRMQREYGSKAASMLADVEAGKSYADQFEFDTAREEWREQQSETTRRQEEEARRRAEEARRVTEEARRRTDEYTQQQQRIEVQRLEESQKQQLLKFDAVTRRMPSGGGKEARSILREQLLKEQQFSKEILEINQATAILYEDRNRKIADQKQGLTVTGRDITAEINFLEQRKKLLEENLQVEKQISQNQASAIATEKTEDISKEITEIDSTIVSARTQIASDTIDNREAEAIAEVNSTYDEYRQSITKTIDSLTNLIEFKKALGLVTTEEVQTISNLKNKYAELDNIQSLAIEKTKEIFEWERRTSELEINQTLSASDNELREAQASLLGNIYGRKTEAAQLEKTKALSEAQDRYDQQRLDLNKDIALNPSKYTAGQIQRLEAALERWFDATLETIDRQYQVRIDFDQREYNLQRSRSVNEIGNQLLGSQSQFLQNRGDEFSANDLLQRQAEIQEGDRYQQQLFELEKDAALNPAKYTPEELAQLRADLLEINSFNLQNIDKQFKDLGETIASVSEGALEEFFSSIFTNTKSIGESFRDMALSILRSIAQIAAKQTVLSLLGRGGGAFAQLFGMAGGAPIPAFATGGAVRGSGTSTSDSILARLSNGEFVVKAAAVRELGTDLLGDLNAVDSQGKGASLFKRLLKRLPGHAQGGLVAESSPERSGNPVRHWFLENFTPIPAFATGGSVQGSGTSTSDSILARLSNGEFVIRAAAVQHWGEDFLAELNSMRSPRLALASSEGRSGNTSSRTPTPTIIMNVTTPDANSFRRSETQIGKDAGEQYRRSLLRNG